MAAPNMNGRLHLTDVHQNSPASLQNTFPTDCNSETCSTTIKTEKFPWKIHSISIFTHQCEKLIIIQIYTKMHFIGPPPARIDPFTINKDKTEKFA